MEFSNLFFLYIFLPLTLAVYFLVPQMRGKNYVLIAASLIFYAMGQPYYLPLLLLTAYANYALAYRIQDGNRAMLAVAVGGNLAVLLLFKLLGQFTSVALPIGISFYTFQLVSYQVDVYRGKTRPAQYFSKLLLYVSMFPKMVMGPIVRYEQVEKQLERRRTNPKAIFEGLIRFVVGLAKKVLIADYAYGVYDQLSNQAFGGAAWLGALMFMFYIYFEFSGCTDMAIGLGRVFGFRYAENFDVPYASSSITEFWRRWHITLGSFFRDYVYIPLGGNRKGRARQILNLLVVWALTGLWHGTSLNFILWGLYFFVLLAIEKQVMPKLERLPFAVRNLLTMFFVLIGWVLFAHENMAELGNTFAMMFGKGAFWSGSVTVILKNSVPLILLCLLGSSVLPRWFAAIWSILLVRQKKQNRFSLLQTLHAVSLFLFAALLLYLCTASLVGASSKPSLYASF
ncbi:MAG: MBOAT family O-acyltransferase [Faecousia sp.]